MNYAENPLFRCFEHQFVLLMRFHEIEARNVEVYETLSGAYSFATEDFESYDGQKRLRELGGRVFEEVAEVLDAVRLSSPRQIGEEVADAFHFLIELFIVSGLNYQDFGTGRKDAMYELRDYLTEDVSNASPEVAWATFLRELGMTLNVLNTRPWKTTPKAFDYALYRSRLIKLLETFLTAAFYTGVSVDNVIEEYFRKARENQKRIESGV